MKTNYIFVLVILVLVIGSYFLLVSFPLVLAHGEEEIDYDGHHEGMMDEFYGMMGMGFFGWIFMVLIVVALVLFIIWLVKELQKKK